MNRPDASLALAPTAACGVAAVRVIGAGSTMITTTITTPPAGTG